MRGHAIARVGIAVLLSVGLAACGGGGAGLNLSGGGSSSSSGSSSSGVGSSSSSGGSSSGASSSSSGSGSSSGVSGVAQALTVASAQNQITADGQSTAVLTAQITDTAGRPIPNLALSFSTNAGTVTPTSATTDTSGKAIARLIASTIAGRATVTVRDPASGLSSVVNVAFVAGPAAKVTTILAPSTVLPGAATTVDAVVADTNGNAVSGEPVTFSAPTNASGGAFQNVTATSDSNGRATTTYTAGGSSGNDVLQAKTAGGLQSQASLSVTPAATLIGSVSVTVGASTVIADGNTQTTVRASVLDTKSNPVPNATVSFASSAGTLSALSATTDSTGNAVVSLKSPTHPGVATISAKTAGFASSSQITFVAGPPVNPIIVTASPSQVAIGGKSTITAQTVDANGNPVSGVVLSFSLTSNTTGATLSVASVTTDANGSATVTFQSGANNSSTHVDTITVSAAGSGGSTISGSATVTASPSNAIVGQLALALANTSIAAAANNSVTVTATVTDSGGNPVIGANVAFSTTGGSLSASSAQTNSSGQAILALTPPTTAGSINVVASISGFNASQTLTVTPGPASAGNSSITASPSTVVADGKSTSNISVLLNDAFNNPLPNGTSVTLLTQAGAFVGGNTQTLSSGRASFTLQAPTASAPSNVVAVQGISGLSTPVAFVTNTSGDPASIRFATSTNSITVTGAGQNDLATITITVLDSSGNPISESSYTNNPINNLRVLFISHPNGGETLTGKNVNGTVQSSATSVDVATSNGVAVVNLQSGTVSGIVEVEAEVLKFSGTSLSNAGDIAATAALPQLSIASGPAASINFTAPKSNAIVNLGRGNYSRLGSVAVTDRYGNKVTDGTVVNLALMDSVIVQDNTGTTAAGAATLSRSGPSLITSTPSGTSDFTSSITRNGTSRSIQNGDLILIQNAGINDKKNTVSAVNSATQLTAISNYINSLSGGQFWVGSSLLGAQIGQADSSGNITSAGTSTTTGGIAPFNVVYPANDSTILSGCYGYNIPGDGSYSKVDIRDSVPQSRQVVVVASAGDNVSTVQAGTFCFEAIAPVVLTPAQPSVTLSTIAGGGSTVTDVVTLTDATGGAPSGDGIDLPFVPLACKTGSPSPASSPFQVTAVGGSTNVNGQLAVSLTATAAGAANDTLTVTCGDASRGVSVNITVVSTGR